MTVIKVKALKDFTILHNDVLEDERISFKAKGLWAYCMSRPDNWEFHVSHLATVSKEKETAIYSALEELKNIGVVTYEHIKNTRTGLFEKGEYTVYPFPPKLKKCLPHPGFPDVDRPGLDNRVLLSTDTLPSTEKEPPPTPSKGVECVKIGKHFSMKKDDFEFFCKKFSEPYIREMADQINDHIDSVRGKPYRDYAATVRTWLRRRANDPKQEGVFIDLNKNVELIEKIRAKFPRHPDIDYGYNYIDFKAFREIGYLKINSNGFREQVENNLRKMNLSI